MDRMEEAVDTVSRQEFDKLKEIVYQQHQTIVDLQSEADFFKNGLTAFIDEQVGQKGIKAQDFQMYKRFMTAQMGAVLTEIKECFTQNSVPLPQSTQSMDTQWKKRIETHIRTVESTVLNELKAVLATKTDYAVLSEPLRKLQAEVAQVKEEWTLKDAEFQLNERELARTLDEKISELRTGLTNTDDFLRIKSTMGRIERLVDQTTLDTKRAIENIQVFEKALCHKFNDSALITIKDSIQQEINQTLDLLKNKQFEEIVHYKEKTGRMYEGKLKEITSTIQSEVTHTVESRINELEQTLEKQKGVEEILRKDLDAYSTRLQYIGNTIKPIEREITETKERINDIVIKSERFKLDQIAVHVQHASDMGTIGQDIRNELWKEIKNIRMDLTALSGFTSNSVESIGVKNTAIFGEIQEIQKWINGTKLGDELKTGMDKLSTEFLEQILGLKREHSSAEKRIVASFHQIIEALKDDIKEQEQGTANIQDHIIKMEEKQKWFQETLKEQFNDETLVKMRTIIEKNLDGKVQLFQKDTKQVNDDILRNTITLLNDHRTFKARMVSDIDERLQKSKELEATLTLELAKITKSEEMFEHAMKKRQDETHAENKGEIMKSVAEFSKEITTMKKDQTQFQESLSIHYNEETLFRMRGEIEKEIGVKIGEFARNIEHQQNRFQKTLASQFNDETLAKMRTIIEENLDGKVRFFNGESKKVSDMILRNTSTLLNDHKDFKSRLIADMNERLQVNKEESSKIFGGFIFELEKIKNAEELFEKTIKGLQDENLAKINSEIMKSVAEFSKEIATMKNDQIQFQESLSTHYNKETLFRMRGEIEKELGGKIGEFARNIESIEHSQDRFQKTLASQFNDETLAKMRTIIEENLDGKVRFFHGESKKVSDMILKNTSTLLNDHKDFKTSLIADMNETLKVNKEDSAKIFGGFIIELEKIKNAEELFEKTIKCWQDENLVKINSEIMKSVAEFSKEIVLMKKDQTQFQESLSVHYNQESIFRMRGEIEKELGVKIGEFARNIEYQQNRFQETLREQFNDETLAKMRTIIEENLDGKVRFFNGESKKVSDMILRNTSTLLNDHKDFKSRLIADMNERLQVNKEESSKIFGGFIFELEKIKNAEELFKKTIKGWQDENHAKIKGEIVKSVAEFSKEIAVMKNDQTQFQESLSVHYNQESIFRMRAEIEKELWVKIEEFARNIEHQQNLFQEVLNEQFNEETLANMRTIIEEDLDGKVRFFQGESKKVSDMILRNTST